MQKVVFLKVSENGHTVQCVVTETDDMVKYAKAITRESLVEIEGIVTVPKIAIKGTSQQVEVQVRKIHCISRAPCALPFNVEDAARSDTEIDQALKDGKRLVGVNQDTRLNYRFIDLRTPANNAIFHLEGKVLYLFREFMEREGFMEIQTPKIIAGSSEGGAAVFKLDLNGEPACLAQSPKLHKQMAICCGFERVSVVGPVFRAENSDTHRHLCQFTGLDVEMKIKEHYFEVMDVVDRLFVHLFDRINEQCQTQLQAIGNHFLLLTITNYTLVFVEGMVGHHRMGGLVWDWNALSCSSAPLTTYAKPPFYQGTLKG